MNHLVKFVRVGLTGLGVMGMTSALAFELSGTGNGLTANGGQDTAFVPIVQAGGAFAVQGLPKTLTCQNPLRPTGIVTVGAVASERENLAVFAGSADIVFTLHWQVGNQGWQDVVPASTIPCQTGQTLNLKATFYRQQSLQGGQGLTRTVNQQFVLQDGDEKIPVRLNATLNFATPPKTYSCKLISAPQQTIRLGDVLVQTLEQQGRVVGGNVVNFTLDCNDTNASVVAMVYDNLDSANFGVDKTVLSIKSGGASGVGVELYKDGQALPLGQKSLGFVPNDPTHWRVQGGEQKTLTLGAGYVKTGTVGAGKVEAQAGLVFFYP